MNLRDSLFPDPYKEAEKNPFDERSHQTPVQALLGWGSLELHVGDFVRIGEVEGVVSEVGSILTKLITMSNEEVAISN